MATINLTVIAPVAPPTSIKIAESKYKKKTAPSTIMAPIFHAISIQISKSIAQNCRFMNALIISFIQLLASRLHSGEWGDFNYLENLRLSHTSEASLIRSWSDFKEAI